MHQDNIHSNKYDFEKLVEFSAELKSYVFINQFGTETIDFSNPAAVKALNQALLKCYYKLDFWDIPENYLCPPIPGRADYIHHLNDLIKNHSKPIRCLDIGVGANCIYPLIGSQVYDWQFVGSDIDAAAIENAERIVTKNKGLSEKISLRLQTNKNTIFKGVIEDGERFELCCCNPPFHRSAEAAHKGSKRKIANLSKKSTTEVVLNFGGRSNELWCDGGEIAFLTKMIEESRTFKDSILWFTSLVSKKDNLKPLIKSLKKVEVIEYKCVEMALGNKISHLLAWTYKSDEDRNRWLNP